VLEWVLGHREQPPIPLTEDDGRRESGTGPER
jgi:hypothetical protein